MIIHLMPGEQIFRADRAALVTSVGTLSGVAALTGARIVFVRNGLPDGSPGQTIPLQGIGEVRRAKLLGLVPTGVELGLVNGEKVRLSVADGAGWLAAIEAARRGETLAPAGLAAGPSGPIDEVVSWPAVAAWIVLPLCFLPLVGLVPALAVLAFGLLLLLRSKRLEDRRAGTAATALAAAALALGGIGVASLVVQGGAPELPRDVHGVVTWPMRVAQVLVLVFSVVLHECGHGLAAYWAGDTTARRAGRLTVNPVRHVDLFGSVILPAILIFSHAPAVFGWAKPVPVNPAAFRKRRLGNIAVSLAGVSANLLVATTCLALLVALGALLRFAFPGVSSVGFWMPGLGTRIDGIPGAAAVAMFADLLKAGVVINLLLMGFNLLPIPPLDGSHILETLLPRGLGRLFGKLRAFGFLILGLLLFTGSLDRVLEVFVMGALILCYAAGAICGLG